MLFVILLLFGIAFSGLLVQDSVNYFQQARTEKEMQGRQSLRLAQDALLTYMLLRSENTLGIVQGNTTIPPRLLMLPCPDNIGGDNNLDGSQEGGCRAAGSTIVNEILDSGSRFGRLPWKSRSILNNAINDGLDIDVSDAAGNRFWYALSRNMAPTTNSTALSRLPLNLHRLVTHADDWLSVRNQFGDVVSNQVAAVILSPGPGRETRLQESVLATLSLNVATAVTAPGAPLAPTRYFEDYTAQRGSVTQTIANYNTDGVFVQAPPDAEQGFNDSLVYLGIRQLADTRHPFAHSYARLLGINDIHNAPRTGQPLWQMAQALEAYHALFGFYPSPARQDNTLHVSTRQRGCARYHSGSASLSFPIAATVSIAATEPVTVSTAAAGLSATVTLAQPGAFLLRQAITVTAAVAATVEYNDMPRTVTALTLARYARLTLAAGAVLQLTAGGLTALSTTDFRLSAAVALQLVSAVIATVAAQTPLRPAGALLGWLPEHPQSNRRAGNDGWRFTLQADTRAMFWSTAQLTLGAVTITAGSGDVLTLAAGEQIRLEQDVAARPALSGRLFTADGRLLTVAAMIPSGATFSARQFVVWLQADARRGVTARIEAPAVLFPWRHEIGSLGADSRDNLLSYPPCLDTRDFFGGRLQTTAEDQTVIYAVAEECHYGGDPAICGRQGGFTVSVAAGAAVALPQAVTVTTSFTVTIGNFLTLSVQSGTVVAAAAISLRQAVKLPLLSAGGDTVAIFQLKSGDILPAGSRLVLSAGTPIVGSGSTVFEQVPALLLYSPAPLPRAACTLQMAAAIAGTLAAATLVVANQQTPATDITPLCYWLDDEENADRDNFYVIYPPEHDDIIGKRLPPRNDYFILFGGRLRTG